MFYGLTQTSSELVLEEMEKYAVSVSIFSIVIIDMSIQIQVKIKADENGDPRWSYRGQLKAPYIADNETPFYADGLI